MKRALKLIGHVAVSTAAQTTGRAVNVAIAFAVLNEHGATALTDHFFLTFAIAFFFFGTLAGAITDATIPLAARGELGAMHAAWYRIACFAAVATVVATWTSVPLDALGTALSSLGAGLMAGSGILAGFYTGILHTRRRFAVTGLLWLVRLAPLALFAVLPARTESISWLTAGIGLADLCRCLALRRLAADSIGTTREASENPRRLRIRAFSHYLAILGASAISGLSPLIARWIAGFGENGNIAILDTAERIYGILGTLSTIGVMNVLLVSLTRLHAHGGLGRAWPRVLAAISAWSLVWLAVALALSSPLPELLVQYSRLSPHQARETTEVYLCYAYGLPSFIVGLAGVRHLLATGGGRLLAPIAIASVLLNAALAAALFDALGLAGIALASTVTYSIIAVALLILLRGRNGTETLSEQAT
jgi:peptidoglycan biosynthesis protein MviN/MurJ (putative lipid II flippase)